jgi:ABC-2 type transport system ATP-binding protein
MIEVENLTKRFGSHLAIDGITFSVSKGEVLGFLGPNGAGKTTTMRILTGYFPATSGTARVAGYDCFEESMEVRGRIGYLPENVPLYKDMKVEEYLSFVAAIKGVEAKAVRKKVASTMADCGIEGVSRRMIGELSKGYRQRVGLAQALVNDPEVLILDEPTIGLDPKQIRGIRSLIKDLAGRRTVILSTHILPEVSMVCGKVVIINNGKLVATDTPENLMRKAGKSSGLLIRVAGPGDEVAAALRAIEGAKSVAMERSSADGAHTFRMELDEDSNARQNIPREIVARNWDLLEIRSLEASLEDVFVQLVTQEEAA